MVKTVYHDNGHQNGRMNGRPWVRTAVQSAQGFEMAPAREARERGATSEDPGIDSHLKRYWKTILQLARKFERENGFLVGIAERLLTLLIGDSGLELILKSPKKLQAKQDALYREWSEAPEISGRFDWVEVQEMLAWAFLVDGDIGAILVDRNNTGTGSPQIQLIEAERIDDAKTQNNPNVSLGIKTDAFLKPLSYFVRGEGGSGLLGANGQPFSKTREYSADEFVHILHTRRHNQRRGLSPLMTVYKLLGHIASLADNEAQSADLAAHFAILSKMDQHPPMNTNEEDDTLPETSLTRRIKRVPGAIMIEAAPGEDLNVVENKRPSPNFAEGMKMFATLIGMPVGMSHQLLFMDWSEANYSSARASIGMLFKEVCRWRKQIVKGCSKVWKFNNRQWIESGRLKADIRDPAVYRHEWRGASSFFLDIQKEMAAKEIEIDRNISMKSDVQKSMGKDPDEFDKAFDSALKQAADDYDRLPDNVKAIIPPAEYVRRRMGFDQGKTLAAVESKKNKKGGAPE